MLKGALVILLVLGAVVNADDADYAPDEHEEVYCPPCPFSSIDENQACRRV